MYTKFDGTKKVLAIMQVVESDTDADAGEDLGRRKHCNTKDEAATVIPASNEEFDHWKTYGAQEHFGKQAKSGYYSVNAFYPDVKDPGAVKSTATEDNTLIDA